jgi:hypothetical protein
MITLRTYRQYVETAVTYFFEYVDLYKQTRVNNLVQKNLQADDYLSAVVINCILDEIEWLFDKKLLTTKAQKIKFEFSDAQGIVFYKTLLALPLPKDQVYFHQIRQEWLELLHQELIQIHIYEHNKLQKQTSNEYEHGDWNVD